MKFLSFFKRKKPQITIATYDRKKVDCSYNNEIHTKLRAELSNASKTLEAVE